jgi:hypothetical protein
MKAVVPAAYPFAGFLPFIVRNSVNLIKLWLTDTDAFSGIYFTAHDIFFDDGIVA